MFILAAVFTIAAVLYGVHWWTHARFHVSTDDAYVSGNLIRITPRITGTVIAVLADDTDAVEEGQTLVQLDDSDARLALVQAEAELAQAVRRIRQRFAFLAEHRARIAARQHAYQQAQAEAERRTRTLAAQAVSREEAERANSIRDQASAELELARAQLAAAEAELQGTAVHDHPEVEQAKNRMREAWLDLARCQIRAPATGQIAKRSVQLGQRVNAGDALMALVPLHQLWVDANYKEDQLKGMAIGQTVKLVSDLYGTGTVFQGRIIGVAAGTGSVFSLLPPQNASGNWIKIVQRLPVRIALDDEELTRHPLRVGLSMTATVDTRSSAAHEQEPAAAAAAVSHTTTIYEDELEGIEARIEAIVAANLATAG